MTRVTVLLTVYNGMPYLPDAVGSILGQTLQDFFFLIIDDGSADGTSSYLDGLTDPRVKVIRQENRGQGAALNTGLSLCNTEYVARMDADDISLPRRLELQLDYMERNPDVVMLGSQIEFMAGKKTFSGPRLPLSHKELRASLMRGQAVFCHGAGIFRTEVMNRICGYRILKSGQDTDLFLRMSEAGRIANLDEVLYLMRFHRESDNFLRRAEINQAVAYAIECAKCRQQGINEPSYDDFADSWKTRAGISRLFDRIDCWSTLEYRNALMDLAESKSLRGAARLACASILRPAGVARRVSGWLASAKKEENR